MAQVALQPPRLTSQTHWPPDINDETQQMATTLIKKSKSHGLKERDANVINGKAVPE